MALEVTRRLGRPDQRASEALNGHILDTAAKLFIEQGFTATSLEQIACAAGAGKQTLYRRFASKQSLFQAVIDRETGRQVAAAKAAAATGDPPLQALRQTCRAFLDFVLRREMVALHRILIAECVRFPDLGRHVLDTCLAPYTEALGALIRAASDAGQMAVGDDTDLRDLLLGLIVGWPSQKALLDPDTLRTSRDRDRYFDNAWNLFLHATALPAASVAPRG